MMKRENTPNPPFYVKHNMIGNLTYLGVFHTLVSLISIVSGAVALIRDRKISLTNRWGQTYLGTMVITCATALGIYQHGGFGPGHGLTIATLVLMAVGSVAELRPWFGGASIYVQVITFSLSYFLLLLFALMETLTRVPPQQPLAADFDAPLLGTARSVLLLLTFAGIGYQVAYWRAAGHKS